jgi:predicted Holliday junction resolvase-like endonuclease
MTFLVILLSVWIIYLLYTNSVHKREKKNISNELSTLQEQLEQLKENFSQYQKSTEPLRKYEGIKNVEQEYQRILKESEELINEANESATAIKKEARSEAKEIKFKAEEKLKEAHDLASKIEEAAKLKAEEIAGDAWLAKQNADQYEQTVKAMKNIIKGYGDEYLIPNHSVLDELAEEYDHKEAGRELTKVRTLIKSMIKNGEAADCDYVEAHRRTIAIEFVLDAFNGKVDTIMSKVRHDNYGKLLQELNDAFRLVNHNGKPFRNARINERYFEVIVEQLKLAVTVNELKKKDQEEQRRIREEMREEEKARRDYEKAKKQAEKEEKMLAKAMKEVEAKLLSAAEEERMKFEEELAQLKEKLTEAEEKGQRAMSMAQQTKQGHVYVISNIGSFGDDVLKIGLTRRLDPMDRVKELGDASVPFSFDVHAMIYSDDAPKLEKELHEVFKNHQVNKVNYRKEFFNVPLKEVRSKVEELELETHWTMKAEALEYRESLQLAKAEGLEVVD